MDVMLGRPSSDILKMVRKLRVLLCSASAAILLSSCTRETPKASKIAIKFPEAASNLTVSQSVSALSTQWGLSDPAASNAINCYAVIVEAADFAGTANSCKTLAGVAAYSPHFIAGGFAAGSSQEIDVPSGKRRTISLIGFQTDDISLCKPIDGKSTGFAPAHFSSPFLLASTAMDLEPSTQAIPVVLTVPAAIPATKFEDCSPFAFAHVPGGVVPVIGPTAILSGAPVSPANASVSSLDVTISGSGVVDYLYTVVQGSSCAAVTYSSNIPVANHITPPLASFTDGSISICVKGVDATGAIQSSPSVYTFTRDWTPPATPGSLTLFTPGSSPSNVATPSFGVSGLTSGDIVKLYKDPTCSSPLTTMTAAGSSLTISSSTLSVDGAYVFRVQTFDAAGNSSGCGASPTVNYTFDATAPTAFSISGITGGTDANVDNMLLDNVNATLNWSATTGETQIVAKIYAADGTTVVCGPVNAGPATTSYNFSSCGLTPGSTYNAAAFATDDAGNMTATGQYTFTVQMVGNLYAGADNTGYDFGTVTAGSTTDHTMTFLNEGTFPVSSLSANITGSPDLHFKGGSFPGTGGTCGPFIGPTNSCTIVVTYSPASAGSDSASLDFMYDNGVSTGLTFSLPLDGNAIVPAVLTISDGPSYDFGNVGFGTTPSHTFTVSNSGGLTATTMNASALGGTFTFKGGSYPGTGGNCGANLSAASTCTVVVDFKPLAITSFSDTLTITYNDGTSATSASRALYGTGVPAALTVAALYSNGANWNEYVVNDGGGNPFAALDNPCAGTETGHNACIHGGEIRMVDFPPLSNCTSLSLTDTLSAFNWTCDQSSGHVKYIGSLKPNKGLRDLVGASAWLNNSVTLQLSGTTIGTSTPGAWWSNTVMALPSNPSGPSMINLSTAGTVYTVTSPYTTAGYSINADRISIVTLAAGGLNWYNGSGNCDYMNAVPSSFDRCMLVSANMKYLWLELNMSGGTNGEFGLLLNNTRFAHVMHSNFKDFTGAAFAYGIGLTGAFNSTLYDFSVVNATIPLSIDGGDHNFVRGFRLGRGTLSSGGLLMINNSSYNIFSDGRLTDNPNGVGIDVMASNNTFQDLNISNIGGNSGDGSFVRLITASNNTFSRITGTGCGEHGFNFQNLDLSSDSGNIVSHATIANCMYAGVMMSNSSNNGLNGVVVAEAGDGIQLVNSGATHLSNIALTDIMTAAAINGDASSEAIATGAIKSVSLCTAGTGLSASCGAINASTHTHINTTSFGSDFVGAITATDDSVNISDSNGGVTLSPTTDLFGFMNPFRSWSKDYGSAWPDDFFRGYSSGVARIFDFSLRSLASVVRNNSYDGSASNGAFAIGSPCPNAVNGSQTVTMAGKTFLRNADEVVLDVIGNNDGLCESNEVCVYAPNFGSYQGSGDPFVGGTCNFANGTVTGVTMFGFPVNGE